MHAVWRATHGPGQAESRAFGLLPRVSRRRRKGRVRAWTADGVSEEEEPPDAEAAYRGSVRSSQGRLSDVTKAKACIILLFAYAVLVLVAVLIRIVRSVL